MKDKVETLKPKPGMKHKVETEVTLIVVPGICSDFGYFPKIEEGPPNTIILN